MLSRAKIIYFLHPQFMVLFFCVCVFPNFVISRIWRFFPMNILAKVVEFTSKLFFTFCPKISPISLRKKKTKMVFKNIYYPKTLKHEKRGHFCFIDPFNWDVNFVDHLICILLPHF